MRRQFVVLLATFSILVLGVPAQADAPSVDSFRFFGFDCEFFGDPGAGFLFIETGDEGDAGDAAIWLPGTEPFEGEPDLISDFDRVEVSIEGDQVTATFTMVPLESEGPEAVLTLEGTIGPLVDEENFSDRFREGNRWVEIDETVQIFEATGDVRLDGEPFDSQCSARNVDSTVYSTNPHAFRIAFEDAFMECFGIAGSDGSTLNLFAGEFGEGSAFLDLEIFAPNGDGGGEPVNGDQEPIPELFGSAEIPGLAGDFEVSVPLFAPFDGEEPVDEAQVSLSISEGEVISSRIVFQNGKVKETETQLITAGSVGVMSDGRTFDLAECSGARFQARGIETHPSGPQMKGPVPDNDVPSGAVPLESGDRVNQQTKATALHPEATCPPFEGEEGGEGEVEQETVAPFGKTVWYSIEGTGEPVTVDTAGSGFDTFLALYRTDGDGELEPLECVDDVFEDGFSLQARLTWETEPTTTYLIQVGGFGFIDESPEGDGTAEYGLLKLSLNS